ncbi:hypothetical protein [Alkaliphilus transvaalensis]|uniref:hypothetical protein n=1 Tax=Alkaliphilus transvaalensis TaxID=114628 RepID=UPI00146FA5B9|nr:hypothetical protein [Alkaliphilus transvaalensis]
MAKKSRGKGLINLPSRGRGTCPICKKERIKILYEVLQANGGKLTVCKGCRHKTV